jgi:DNA-directed RNA polymerase specialized sigma24 family protein
MIPSIIELMPSVLKILADGELHGKREIDRIAAAEFGVTDSEMKEKISCGANKFKNRMGWALINLKNKGLIKKEGKTYQITDIGAKAASASPVKLTAKFVKSLSEDAKKKSDDDQPKSGGGSPVAAEEPATAVAEEPQTEEITAGESVDAGDPVDLSMYAGIDPDSDFMLVIKAKIGDKQAAQKLWGKYSKVLVPMFRHCQNLTADEKVSEAALVFARKLELFKPERIGKTPEQWTFSYMLTGGAKNAVDKIIRHSKKEGKFNLDYNAEVCDSDNLDANAYSAIAGRSVTAALTSNQFDFVEKYGPEIHAMRAMDTPLEEKESELMSQLSPLQITILQLRRAGKTVQEIADEMGCGFTKVRLSIVKARELASSIFEVNYA